MKKGLLTLVTFLCVNLVSFAQNTQPTTKPDPKAPATKAQPAKPDAKPDAKSDGDLALPPNDCYKRLEDAFVKRGAFTIADEMHKNVIISFFGTETQCVTGKVRVENGTIVSVFLQYDDDTYEPFEKKFYNMKKQAPTIANGISEMIMTPDGEKFKVVFIDKLKPKQKNYKAVTLPEDL